MFERHRYNVQEALDMALPQLPSSVLLRCFSFCSSLQYMKYLDVICLLSQKNISIIKIVIMGKINPSVNILNKAIKFMNKEIIKIRIKNFQIDGLDMDFQ